MLQSHRPRPRRHRRRRRFRHDRQDEVGLYLTTEEPAVYRPALDSATDVIEGFQSPHGLELLATVDWLNRRAATPLDVDRMIAAIAAWPGPTGSAERKNRIFTRHHLEVAAEHLREIGATSGSDIRPSPQSWRRLDSKSTGIWS